MEDKSWLPPEPPAPAFSRGTVPIKAVVIGSNVGACAASLAQSQTLAQQVMDAAQNAAASFLPGVVPLPNAPAGTPAAPLSTAGFSPLLVGGVLIAGLLYFTKGKGRR